MARDAGGLNDNQGEALIGVETDGSYEGEWRRCFDCPLMARKMAGRSGEGEGGATVAEHRRGGGRLEEGG
jgi:hypothetical protein